MNNLSEIRELEGQLTGLVGCDDLKAYLRGVVLTRMRHKKALENPETGITEDQLQGKQYSSFIFYGPPGTGKTHNARMITKLLHQNGVIEKNEMVEMKSLTAKHVGQTDKLVMEEINKCRGGQPCIQPHT